MDHPEEDYACVVRRNHDKTTAYLLAHRPPCTTIRDDEIDRINRNLVPLSPQDLQGLKPTGSWMLAVILCPDDDLTELAAWTKDRDEKDRDRIRFYVHPDVDLVRALKPWYAKGLDDPPIYIVSDWKSLHPPFGRDLNNQVYKDAKKRRP